MTNSEQENSGQERGPNSEQLELIHGILDDCQAFARDIPRHVEIHYGRPRTPTATMILENTAIRSMHFTNGELPHSHYFYEGPVGGFAGVAARSVRLPDEAMQDGRLEAGYRGRIIDLSLRGEPEDLSPAWQCSLYLHQEQQPVLIDQDVVRGLGTEIGDNTVTAVDTIVKSIPYGAVYYPSDEELRTLKLIMRMAHMTQRDLATTLHQCAAEASNSQNTEETTWFSAAAAHIDMLRQQSLKKEIRDYS